jgi:hypothetical protein
MHRMNLLNNVQLEGWRDSVSMAADESLTDKAECRSPTLVSTLISVIETWPLSSNNPISGAYKKLMTKGDNGNREDHTATTSRIPRTVSDVAWSTSSNSKHILPNLDTRASSVKRS